MAEYPLPSYKRLILPWFFTPVKGKLAAAGDFFRPLFDSPEAKKRAHPNGWGRFRGIDQS